MEQDIMVVVKLLISAALGAFIGYERERQNRWAGFRTHILVCMGSCLIMITSIEVASIYAGVLDADPGRLGAQVVSGIGFLGAGTILHSPSRIRGLTTAATLWIMAAIGLAVGVGLYWAAIAATLLAYVVLDYFRIVESRIKKVQSFDIWNIEFFIESDHDGLQGFFQFVEQYDLAVKSINLSKKELGTHVIVDIKAPHEFDESNFISDLQRLLKVSTVRLKKNI